MVACAVAGSISSEAPDLLGNICPEATRHSDARMLFAIFFRDTFLAARCRDPGAGPGHLLEQ